MSSVKVAVRVRPFNTREKEAGAKRVIEMEGNTTKITDPETGKDRKFTFDYSYWSFSGFKEEPNGEHVKDSPNSPYADQRQVFNDMGLDVINNAFEGYHTCLFAYGQTGSGKSYSIVGYGPDKGIVPKACEEIFTRIKKKLEDPNCNIKFEVTVSMLEIYNEHIQDLFTNPNNRPKGGLKVRESPAAGVFVEGLSKIPVTSYDEIQRQYDIGNNNRTIASTLMNATSSRAHTIFSIVFKQRSFDPNTKLPTNEKVSQIHLVDLAGSERVGDTGASGQRLLEGTNINKSLSVLGKCISILAEKASGKKRDAVVPYRESNLTRILQNALGGNSKTCMIAAVSPASICFEESLSTLRYADQVKQIKNVAIINESPQDKLIRELKEENEKLRKKLMGGDIGSEGNTKEEIERLRKAYEEQLEINRLARQEIEKEEANRKEAQEKPAESPKAPEVVEEPWKTKFHLANLNEDPFLAGKIRHIFKEGVNVIGKADRESMPDIVIGGVGVLKNHCTITFDGSALTLAPSADPNAAKIFVNGKLVTEPVELAHSDRILFGAHNYFVVNDPSQPENNSIDWDYANKEVIQDQLKAMTSDQEALLQKKLKEMEEKYEAERKKAEEEAKKKLEEQMKEVEEKRLAMEKEYEEKMKQVQEKGGSDDEVKKLQEEMEKMKAEAEKSIKATEENLQKQADEEAKRQKKIKEQEEFKLRNQKELEERLAQVIPKINEVNEICLQLGRLNYLYSPTIVTDVQGGQMRSKICVKIFPDHSQSFFNQVDMDEFMDKYYLVQEKFQNYQYDLEHSELGKVEDTTDDDPKIFGIAIKNDWILIGQAHIYTDSIAHLLETLNDQTPLIDNKGNTNGELKYSVVPKYLENGVEQNLIMFDNIDQLEGKTLHVLFKIHNARGLPAKYNNEVVCKYKWIDEKNEEYQTEVITAKTINPEFNYEKEHDLFVSPYVVSHIWEGAIAIGVYGKMSQENLNQLVKGANREKDKTATNFYTTMKPDKSTIASGEPQAPIVQTAPMDQLTKGDGASDQNSTKLVQEIARRDAEIRELKEQLRRCGNPTVVKSSSCCTIF